MIKANWLIKGVIDSVKDQRSLPEYDDMVVGIFAILKKSLILYRENENIIELWLYMVYVYFLFIYLSAI